MRRGGWRIRRSRAQVVPLLLLVLLATVVGGVAAGLYGYAATATRAGISATLTGSDAEPPDVRITVTGAESPDAADAAVAAAVSGLLAGTPHDLLPVHPGEGSDAAGSWRVAPRTADLDPQHLSHLRHRLPLLPDRLERDTRLQDADVEVVDELTPRVVQADDRLTTARAVTTVPVTILAATGLLAFGALGIRLGAARREETLTLRARGVSWTRLVTTSLVESLAVVGLPLLLGALVAQIFGWLVVGGPSTGPPPTLLALAVSASVLTTTAGLGLLACALRDAGVLGVGLPTLQRQTPQWLKRPFGPVWGALVWGIDLGQGWSTHILYTGYYGLVGWALLHATPTHSALVFAAFGLGRALPVVVAGAWNSPSSSVVRRYLFQQPLLQRANAVALAVTGAFLIAASR